MTAEPYFAVTQPSDVVVMENVIRTDTKETEDIDAKYELLKRGQYTMNIDRKTFQPVRIASKDAPLELYEARNALNIARWSGADHYAADTYAKAAGLLSQAEAYWGRNIRKSAQMMARNAAQTAEDARLIALKREEEERLEKERQAAADRENQARMQAEEAAHQRQIAQEQALASEREARLEAQRRADAEAATRTAEAATRSAEAERAAADKAKLDAQAAQQQAAADRAAAEAARQAAVQQQQAAQQEAERARTAAADADRMRMQAEQDKENLRQQLLQQFSMILQTRDTARGLIVNMSDVLFDTGKYTLRPGAREKLARLSGIILSHPGLKIEVEGHTDSVGGDAYNQKLSESRAAAVQQYLVGNGLDPNNVSAKGFGKTMPVASNDTAAGRQQNRRVELVVSGEIIGTKLSDIRTMGNGAGQPAAAPATGVPVQPPK